MAQHFSGDPKIRVSDTERSSAIAALSQYYAEGRLTMTECDERCAAVAAATNRGELDALFTDLPTSAIEILDSSEPTYTASEVSTLHRKGSRPRAGILGLTTVATITGTAVLAPTTALAPVLLALIPIVFILLYVMKVGPDSWYAPSPQQLERARLRELKKAEQQRDAELRAQRKERTHELTSRAFDVAEKALGRGKDKG